MDFFHEIKVLNCIMYEYTSVLVISVYVQFTGIGNPNSGESGFEPTTRLVIINTSVYLFRVRIHRRPTHKCKLR